MAFPVATRSTGFFVTADIWNSDVVDNMNALQGSSTSFTPVLTFGGSSAGITYTLRTGHFAKVGELFQFWLEIIVNDNGSATGAVKVDDLPFVEGDNIDRTCVLALFGASGLTGAGQASVDNSGESIGLYQWGASGLTAITEANIPNGCVIRISGSFRPAP